MSLIAWYPLNGDLKNYIDSTNPLENLNPSVNTVTNDGIIGKTYTNTSNSSGTLLSKKKIILPASSQSMFCWINMPSIFNSSNLNAICGCHRYSKNYGMGITVKYVSATTGYLSVNTGTGSSRTYNTYCGSTLLNTNTWYHVGFTYDGSKIRFYVNGVLDGTTNYSRTSFLYKR